MPFRGHTEQIRQSVPDAFHRCEEAWGARDALQDNRDCFWKEPGSHDLLHSQSAGEMEDQKSWTVSREDLCTARRRDRESNHYVLAILELLAIKRVSYKLFNQYSHCV